MSSEFRRKEVRVAMGAFQSLFCRWGTPRHLCSVAHLVLLVTQGVALAWTGAAARLLQPHYDARSGEPPVSVTVHPAVPFLQPCHHRSHLTENPWRARNRNTDVLHHDERSFRSGFVAVFAPRHRRKLEADRSRTRLTGKEGLEAASIEGKRLSKTDQSS